MSASAILLDSSKQHSTDRDIELLDPSDILASITDTSNAINSAAASLVAENERGHRRVRIVCYPAVTVKAETVPNPSLSNYELNLIALARTGNRDNKHSDGYLTTTAEAAGFSISLATILFGEHAKWLSLVALSAATFLIQLSLLGTPLAVAMPVLLRYGTLAFALGIGAASVRFIFSQGRISGLAPLQKTLLYTAGFLLIYELWILFSIVVGQLR